MLRPANVKKHILINVQTLGSKIHLKKCHNDIKECNICESFIILREIFSLICHSFLN